MNMIIVSNISVWIILIITIFKLNRDRRKSNSNIGLASVFMSFGTKFATISIKSMATH